MHKPIALALLASTCLAPSLFAGDKKNVKALPQVEVVVLKAIPPAASYNWRGSTDGNGPAPCTAAGCDRFYMPPPDSAPTSDVVLRLLLPDARILIAECDAKEAALSSYAIKFAKADNTADVPIQRTCAAPGDHSHVMATVDGDSVRLFIQEPGPNGTDSILNELYRVRGTLTSTAPNDAGHAPASDSPSAGSTQCFVSTIPYGAQIFLDGERVGTSPVQVTIPAPTEKHLFTIKKDGYVTYQVTIKPNSEETHFSFRLQPNS
jgi:hypothetical protein